MFGFSAKRTQARLCDLEEVMVLDVPVYRQIRDFLGGRQDELNGNRDWRFVNRMLRKRAARGARLCRMYMRFSLKRAFPCQYSYFLQIGEICRECARNGQEQCPVMPDAAQED